MHMHVKFLMRTTIEIDDDHRAELLKLAAQRHEKGFSSIVREALDFYLEQHRAKKDAVNAALAVQGSFSQAEAEAMRASISALRERWR
jgi:predicted transcriptional regulator